MIDTLIDIYNNENEYNKKKLTDLYNQNLQLFYKISRKYKTTRYNKWKDGLVLWIEL